jgi:hypothetical protein
MGSEHSHLEDAKKLYQKAVEEFERAIECFDTVIEQNPNLDVPLISPVHNLNTSENFSTIQDAIYDVNDGNIIEAPSGRSLSINQGGKTDEQV